MSELNVHGSHLDDNTLWQWRSQELEATTVASTQQHVQICPSCQQRSEAIDRLINEMRTIHQSIQPTLAEQMRLFRALKEKFMAAKTTSVLVTASHRLVRWLAPAVAVLAMLFLLLRQETTPNSDTLTVLLPEMPESQLFAAATDEQLQQAMLELAFSLEESKR